MADNINSKNEIKNQAEILKEIEDMYRAGVHFGYSRSLRHPKMKPYFLNFRNNLEVFHLERTYPLLKNALEFMKKLGAEKSQVLFVASKPEARDIVEKVACRLGMPYVTERWLGGTLTNFSVLKKRIHDFKSFKEGKNSKSFTELSKKERGRLEKKFGKMDRVFSGIENLDENVKALLVVDSGEEDIAVSEAKKKNIPVIAVLNSDCNPAIVDYPVPANDAAVSSVQYLMDKFAEAYKSGMEKASTGVLE